MLALVLTIAVGMLIAIAVLDALPSALQAVSGALGVVFGLVLGLSLLALVYWLFEPWLDRLANAVGLRASILGPRILLGVLVVVWCVGTWGAVRELATILRRPLGTGDTASIGCSSVAGFMCAIPLALAQQANDPLLDTRGRPLWLRLVMFSPLLVSLAILALAMTLHVVGRMRRARTKK